MRERDMDDWLCMSSSQRTGVREWLDEIGMRGWGVRGFQVLGEGTVRFRHLGLHLQPVGTRHVTRDRNGKLCPVEYVDVVDVPAGPPVWVYAVP